MREREPKGMCVQKSEREVDEEENAVKL